MYHLVLWAEQHSGQNSGANPEPMGANVDDLAPPPDRQSRVVLVDLLPVSPGAFSLRHSQVTPHWDPTLS